MELLFILSFLLWERNRHANQVNNWKSKLIKSKLHPNLCTLFIGAAGYLGTGSSRRLPQMKYGHPI